MTAEHAGRVAAVALMACFGTSAAAAECGWADYGLIRLGIVQQAPLRSLATAVTGNRVSEVFEASGNVSVLLGLSNAWVLGSHPAAGVVPSIIKGVAGAPVRIAFELWDQGRWQTLCESRVALQPSEERVLVAPNAIQGGRLRVTAETARPLPQPARLKLRVFDTKPSIADTYVPGCATVDLSEDAAMALQPLQSLRIGGAHGCSVRSHVRSSEALAIRSVASVSGASGIQVALGFKAPTAYYPFAPHCTGALPGRTFSAALVAGVSRNLPVLGAGGDFLWAIDAVLENCGDDAEQEIEVVQVRARGEFADSVRQDTVVATAYGVPAVVPSLHLSCFSNPDSHTSISGWRKRPTLDGSRRPLLNMQVARRTGALTQKQQEAIAEAALHAVSAWNRACLTCGPEALALVRVNQTLYVRSTVLERAADLAALPGAGFGRWSERVLDSTSFQVPAYLPATAADIANLCKPQVRSSLGFASCSVQGPQLPPDAPKLNVVLTDGYTSCDSDPETIGCERSGLLVELNIRDFAFTAPLDSQLVIGAGDRKVPLDLVLAHEIGHWLGLGHVEYADALMSASMATARCISNADVKVLLDAKEGRAPPGLNAQTFRFR